MFRAITLSTVLLLPLALATSCAASKDQLAAFMPADDAVKGFKAIKGTDQYCASAGDLHLIYDGGDGEYKKAGVTEALQRLYKSGKVIVTVTVHAMGGDWKKAKAFYGAKQKGIVGKQGYVALSVKNAGSYGPVQGNTLLGFSWTKHYFVSYTVSSQDQTAAAKGFIETVAGKMAK